MKYLYSVIFILTLGFIIAAAEQHLNVENSKIEDITPNEFPEPYSSFDYDDAHGIPYEFLSGNIEHLELHNEEAVFVSSAQIKEPYVAQFEQLQHQALQEITNLIGVIIEDYSTKKANGESISYLNFYRTYYPKLKQIESNIDTEFAETYAQVEKELVHYGFSPDKALKFKEQYDSTKQEKLKELMSLILGQ
ncbi:hypothetical protein H1D32_22155 [Anaerobacillus sp. CMMVII]|uniref:hypothetical protein n=1 Tax=Anaerobacillus sp. CMMVII TaxID=2755588 RepID=UPI0021B8494C|nr:hypothetical protein [Anaerobacillus sp. CMMVII]MCT8140160.1 hypothetical protein [Anaerobacillus sp. CMMVII]